MIKPQSYRGASRAEERYHDSRKALGNVLEARDVRLGVLGPSVGDQQVARVAFFHPR